MTIWLSGKLGNSSQSFTVSESTIGTPAERQRAVQNTGRNDPPSGIAEVQSKGEEARAGLGSLPLNVSRIFIAGKLSARSMPSFTATIVDDTGNIMSCVILSGISKKVIPTVSSASSAMVHNERAPPLRGGFFPFVVELCLLPGGRKEHSAGVNKWARLVWWVPG